MASISREHPLSWFHNEDDISTAYLGNFPLGYIIYDYSNDTESNAQDREHDSDSVTLVSLHPEVMETHNPPQAPWFVGEYVSTIPAQASVTSYLLHSNGFPTFGRSWAWDSISVPSYDLSMPSPEHEFNGAMIRVYHTGDQIITTAGNTFVAFEPIFTRECLYLITMLKMVKQNMFYFQLDAYMVGEFPSPAHLTNWPSIILVTANAVTDMVPEIQDPGSHVEELAPNASTEGLFDGHSHQSFVWWRICHWVKHHSVAKRIHQLMACWVRKGDRDLEMDEL